MDASDELLRLIQSFGQAHAEWAVKQTKTAHKETERAAKNLLKALLERKPTALEIELVNADNQYYWSDIRKRHEKAAAQ